MEQKFCQSCGMPLVVLDVGVQSKKVDQAMFVAPILDMKVFIEGLPSREDNYYEWVIENPITHWDASTYILRPELDMIVNEEVGRYFISRHKCQVTIIPDGEHWFHTPEKLAFLKEWEESTVLT